jgi:hypothetical protein
LYQATNAVAGHEPAVRLRADRVDDAVVHAEELVVRDVATHLHVAEEAEPVVAGDPLECLRDRLDVRVIRRDAEADETPRRRQPLDQVDGRRRIGGEQRARGVETCGTRADHGHAEWAVDAHVVICGASRLLVVAAAGGFAVFDLEAVTASARARGVRVLDREP